MNFNRIGRILVCLLLVCALLINISPIKAKADVVSGAVVVGGAVVSVPAAIAVAATLVAIGIIADAASDNPYAFQSLVDDVTDSLSAAGTYVKDGFVEMYRFVTDTGEAVYYAASDFMEAARTWLFDSGCITVDSGFVTDSNGDSRYLLKGYYYSSPILSVSKVCWVNSVGDEDTSYGYATYVYGVGSLSRTSTTEGITTNVSDAFYPSGGGTVYYARTTSSALTRNDLLDSKLASLYSQGYTLVPSGEHGHVSSFGLATSGTRVEDGFALGVVSSVPIDGTSARTWSEAYANRGLYIASGGNQGAPDDGAEGNDGWKFLLPLSLASAAILAAMSQAEQWTGTTPPEFDDYTEKEELIVTPAPEFDGYQAIEIAPVTNPNPDPNPDPGPGTGSDTESGGDSAELNWWQRFSQWFLELRTSVNELPNRFDEHFENLNNNIEEVPSKFETWIQNVQTSVDSVAESILGTADEINAAISNLPNAFLAHVQNILSAIAAVPQAIVSGIRNVLTELFVPDPEFIPNKVESLKAEYKFLDPMLGTGEELKLFFQNIGSQPPIIWIDLGAGSAWHPMGGKVKFIDLTWYAQYKPTVDPIVGGFIWLWVAWRMFKAVPGLLTGDSGTVGAPIIVPDLSFNQARLPAGRSRRKKDGE